MEPVGNGRKRKISIMESISKIFGLSTSVLESERFDELSELCPQTSRFPVILTCFFWDDDHVHANHVNLLMNSTQHFVTHSLVACTFACFSLLCCIFWNIQGWHLFHQSMKICHTTVSRHIKSKNVNVSLGTRVLFVVQWGGGFSPILP
jgi:hypothetical protein